MAEEGERKTFSTFAEFKADNDAINLAEGRRLQERQLDCAYLARTALAGGLIGGVIVSSSLVHHFRKRYPFLKTLYGAGFVIGGLSFFTSYFLSRFMYDNCLGNFIRSMRLAAEHRHQHYFDQIMRAPPSNAANDQDERTK